MLSVTYFYREPRKTGFSIEGIFGLVSEQLKNEISIRNFYCDGKLSRWRNIKNAKKFAGEINHITGDVNFLAIGLKGKKNILTIHDFGYYENPVHPFYVKIVYRLFWFYLPLKNIEIVTVVSNFTKEKLIRYFQFPETKIRVIPNPVKPVFRYTPRVSKNKLPVILMLGSGKHKNLDNLIAAAKDVPVHLDIIGWPSADELDRLKQYNIEHTIYNGLSDEAVYERYVSCDILFIASHYEGFGMPIIEAQAVGRAVITSNIGAMKELGEGSTVLVNPNSVDEIKSAIKILGDTHYYDDLVKKGIENAARFSADTVAARYLRVYEELAIKF